MAFATQDGEIVQMPVLAPAMLVRDVVNVDPSACGAQLALASSYTEHNSTDASPVLCAEKLRVAHVAQPDLFSFGRYPIWPAEISAYLRALALGKGNPVDVTRAVFLWRI